MEGVRIASSSRRLPPSRVAAAQPIVAKWKNVVLNAVPRPSAPIKDKYNEVSSDFWTAFHNTMSGQGSAEDNRLAAASRWR